MPEKENNNFNKELQEKDLNALAEFFKALGNPTRIHILLLLMEQDTCVSDLANRLGCTKASASQQLRILKYSKLVKQRRDGKMTFYSLANEPVKMVLEKALEHILQKNR